MSFKKRGVQWRLREGVDLAPHDNEDFLYVEVTFRVAFVAKRKHFAVDSCEPSPFKKKLFMLFLYYVSF